jgi:CO/xanthine dehydrogenase FAD-binding subunit
MVSVAVAVAHDGDVINDVQVALGGVAARPWRLGDRSRAVACRWPYATAAHGTRGVIRRRPPLVNLFQRSNWRTPRYEPWARSGQCRALS